MNRYSQETRPASVAEIDRITSELPGWLDPLEGQLLYRFAQRADPDTDIVEIGSWHGKSTIWLGAGAQAGRGARVVAIDPHSFTPLHREGETTEPALRMNLERAGVADQVEVVVTTSARAAARWNRPLSLLWIDGDHSYESARQDFLLWERHVVEGGVVALHDTFVTSGPERVVAELLIGSRRFTDFGYCRTTSFATKRERLTRAETIRRSALVARRAFYGMRLRAYDNNVLHFAQVYDAIPGLGRQVTRPRRRAKRHLDVDGR